MSKKGLVCLYEFNLIKVYVGRRACGKWGQLELRRQTGAFTSGIKGQNDGIETITKILQSQRYYLIFFPQGDSTTVFLLQIVSN